MEHDQYYIGDEEPMSDVIKIGALEEKEIEEFITIIDNVLDTLKKQSWKIDKADSFQDMKDYSDQIGEITFRDEDVEFGDYKQQLRAIGGDIGHAKRKLRNLRSELIDIYNYIVRGD